MIIFSPCHLICCQDARGLVIDLLVGGCLLGAFLKALSWNFESILYEQTQP
jgi:hypothetical protein